MYRWSGGGGGGGGGVLRSSSLSLYFVSWLPSGKIDEWNAGCIHGVCVCGGGEGGGEDGCVPHHQSVLPVLVTFGNNRWMNGGCIDGVCVGGRGEELMHSSS